MKLFLIVLFALSIPSVCYSQETVAEQQFSEVASGDTFHESILKAAAKRIESAQAGPEKIKARADYWRIRSAMLLPRMRAKIKELVVMQIALEVEAGNESPAVPVVDGRVDTANIDWNALLAFLEKLIPIIITLIGLFGWAFSSRIIYHIFSKA